MVNRVDRVDHQAVMASLEQINDPHVPVSLRRMGMLKDVAIEGHAVTVHVAIPCLGCPAVQMLRDQIQEAVGALEGVAEVRVETLWGSHWQRTDIDPAVHPIFRQYGLQI